MNSSSSLPLVIGISGQIKSGKSIAAEYICQLFSENACILSFAYPLKKMLQDLFYLDYEQLHSHKLKEMQDLNLNVTPRKLMQFFGTDVFRNKEMLRSLFSTTTTIMQECEYPIFLQENSETFWIWHLSKKIESLIAKNNKVVIIVDDVRYEDEYQFLKKTYNAKFIYLNKTYDQDQTFIQKEQNINNQVNHSSEQNHSFLQKNAHYVINNHSTKDYFLQQLNTVVNQMKE